MEVFRGASFRAEQAWSGPTLGELRRAEVKLRWTDKPFRWHANAGTELFVVLSGEVNMLHGDEQSPSTVNLGPGDFLTIARGERHVAHPLGEAVILVIEEAE